MFGSQDSVKMKKKKEKWKEKRNGKRKRKMNKKLVWYEMEKKIRKRKIAILR